MTKKENLPDLPDGWMWDKLENISKKLKAGGTPRTSIREYYENGTIPFVKTEDIVNSNKFLRETKTEITLDGVNSCSAWIVPEYSVLYSMYASYGEPIINKKKVTTSQAIIAYLPPDELMNVEYIYYYLKKIKPELKTRGTTQKNINAKIVRNINVPIPPLNEQKRIVNKIEELFTKVHKSIKELKSLKKKLNTYKKIVLKSAFKGNLVEIKNSIIKTSLSEEFEIIMGQSPKSIHYNKEGEGLPFFQGKKEFTDLYADVQKWSRKANKIAEKDDVLVSIRAPIGPVNLAPAKCGIGRGLAAIKPNSKTKAKLIFYLLRIYQTELKKRGTGSTFRAITKSRLYSLPITLPESKEDRDKILIAIESHFSIIKKLEEIIDNTLIKQGQLKKSILKNAFEGKLIPQNPNDEPAEKLLERIKKEKQKNKI